MRIAFCGAMRSPDISLETLNTDEGKGRIGANSGNFVIGEYGRRTIGNVESFIECGFPWSIPMPAEKFNERFDHLLIFSANWLAHYMQYDFSESVNWLKKIKVPVTLIGLGAQTSLDSFDKKRYIQTLNPSLVELFNEIANHNNSVSTRGYITAELLNEMGIKNVIVTGCPTWFVNGGKQTDIVKKEFSSDFRLGLHADTSNLSIYSKLYNLCADHKDKSFIFQSEFDMIPILQGNYENIIQISTKYQLAPEILKNQNIGKFFGSITDWENYIKTRDLVIGMRVHGTMIAMKNGVPAILLYHDGRTFEFVDVFGLPRWNINTLSNKSLCLRDIYDNTDFSIANKRYSKLLLNYIEFLSKNGLTFNF